MSRYVEVPAARFEEELGDVKERVEARGGSCRWTTEGRERVFEIDIPGRGSIRVFTTLPVGGDAVRSCGADAIRLIVGVREGERFRPSEKAQRILRTAPKGPEAHRIEAFCSRLRAELREAYRKALGVRPCPACGSRLVVRKGKRGPFRGCLSFPNCRHTERM